uniref:Glomulin, FKBP associated protein n=1 Tax=Chelydra serpentina TaxID=8475 RepID=A0A8C3XLR3_CHESE
MATEELQAIIERCQILEEEDFKGEDFNLFQVAGQKCLEEGYAAEVLEVIQNEKNKVIVKSMGWNLVCPLVRCILSYKQEDEKREHCLKILDQLVQLCNPKEFLLGLLEQIEQTSGEQISQTILLLLQPLQTVLLKLHSKKSYSVGLSLSTILNQLSLLPVPYTKTQIREDKLGLCQCCNAVVDFAKPFVDEVVKNMEASTENDDKELKEELLKFCLKSLKYPLLIAQLDQLHEDIEEDPLRHFAAEILGILLDIKELLPTLFSHRGSRNQNWDNQDFLDVERKHSADSLACLSYLVFVQYLGIDCFPMRKKSLKILQLYIDKFDAEGKYTLFRIMASLNLLRYLVIKDNEYDNQTGIWTELNKIEQNFLRPLHTGLNMSKAHYEAEIKKSHNSKAVCSVTVGGEKMPNMTTEMQLQVLRSALFTFDLIESVLARVEELIEVKIKTIT